MKALFSCLLLLQLSAVAQKVDSIALTGELHAFGAANVTASRLEGSWKINRELSNRFEKREYITDTFVFVVDTTAISAIPAKYARRLKAAGFFLSGYLTFGNVRWPFFLVEQDGNTRLIYLREQDGFILDNQHVLFIAVSKDKKNDVMFTGGSTNDRSFIAWDRIH